MTSKSTARRSERPPAWDLNLTLFMNRSMSLRGVGPFFAVISWLGNGKLWYALLILLPVFSSTTGPLATVHMAFVGLVNLLLYKVIKSQTRRPRPCHAYEKIMRGAVPLDEYSFPSGHTMHAVGFSMVATAWFPALLVPLSVFTVLVALSRVILGLHYPTDVMLGATLGMMIAKLSLLFLR